MSIYKKLLEVQKSLTALKKNAKGFGFEYLNGDKLLSEVKPLMNNQGLLLKIEVLKTNLQRIDYVTKTASKSEMNVQIDLKCTWIDSDTGERDENLFSAIGQNDWDKGIGSALTYGERYFILKYFHIQTDHDDTDGKKSENESINKDELQILFDSKITLIDESTIKRVKEALNGNDYATLTKLKAYLLSV
jgi:hypothetical protein